MAGDSYSIAAYGLAAYAVYIVALAVYRLYFSPLAAFPGPKLAALTNWYEFYYDVICEGRFTWQIQDLHKKHGPIVRITPTELHVDDPDYFDTLYSRAPGRRNKSTYFASRFGHASDAFSTADHDLHRSRRRAIAPFFSAAKIAQFEPTIRAKLSALCGRLNEYVEGEGSVVVLSRAWMALTTDIISEYAFGKSYGQLGSEGFEDTLHEALVTAYVTGHFALHFPVVFPILDSLPQWLVKLTKPEIMPVVGLRKDLAAEVNKIRAGVNTRHKSASHPTIFHELLNNPDLPPEETSNARLGDEAQLIIAAGLITTSWALSVASYHLVENPAIAVRMRDELKGVEEPFEWRTLERLPYLNGIVHEAIRLSHGVVTRDPRLAPDTELRYGEWVIPRNTPVSMTTCHVLMNDEIFPRPKEFVPERWIGRPELERYFVPFGKGTRQCLGINLAQAELYITLATIFTRYQFELHETDRTDVEMAHAYLVPYPKWESKGVRATVERLTREE